MSFEHVLRFGYHNFQEFDCLLCYARRLYVRSQSSNNAQEQIICTSAVHLAYLSTSPVSLNRHHQIYFKVNFIILSNPTIRLTITLPLEMKPHGS